MAKVVLTEEEQRALANQYAENLLKYPMEEQIAITKVVLNLLRGCSWEFIRGNTEDSKRIERYMEEFKKNPNVSVQEVTYSQTPLRKGYLIYIVLPYALSILDKEAKGLFRPEDLQFASNHHQEAIVNIRKLMASRYTGQVGIYCTNDSPTITISGKSYPAFSLTLSEVLQLCVETRYGMVIGGKVRNPNEIMQRADGVIRTATVAPSSNALLVTLSPLGK